MPAIALGLAVEVAETAFWIRYSRRGRPRVGRETMVGATGVVLEACRPVGRVRFEGEAWLARCESGADVGEVVTVRAIEGLTLVVEPRAGTPNADPAPMKGS